MMKKLLCLAATAVVISSTAQAADLKMATLPANLSQAITMATFANIVSSELDDVNIEVAAGGAATAHMLEVGRGNLDMFDDISCCLQPDEDWQAHVCKDT